MKTFLLIVLILSLLVMYRYRNEKEVYLKLLKQEKQKNDTLRKICRDIQRDSIVYRMVFDIPFRTKVLTITQKITDKDLTHYINRSSR